jgi:hypothetical protein
MRRKRVQGIGGGGNVKARGRPPPPTLAFFQEFYQGQFSNVIRRFQRHHIVEVFSKF